MNRLSPNPRVAVITCLVFVFLLVFNAYAWPEDPDEEARMLMQQGEELFRREQFQPALEVFTQALSRARDSQLRADLFLKISRSYYELGNIEKSEENIRMIFELNSDIRIDDSQFDDDYNQIYKKVEAEYWFSIKTEIKMDKEEDRKIIAQISRKPEKKKIKILPMLIIGGICMGAVVLAFTLWNTGKTEDKGILKVVNSTDQMVTINIETITRNVPEQGSILIYLDPGNYTAVFTSPSHSRSYPVTIFADQTSILIFTGWED